MLSNTYKFVYKTFFRHEQQERLCNRISALYNQSRAYTRVTSDYKGTSPRSIKPTRGRRRTNHRQRLRGRQGDAWSTVIFQVLYKEITFSLNISKGSLLMNPLADLHTGLSGLARSSFSKPSSTIRRQNCHAT